MSDSLLQRATNWVRNESPSLEAVRKAYFAMQSKMSRDEAVDLTDAEATQDYLLETYQRSGGNIEELLCTSSPTEQIPIPAQVAPEPRYDASPLVVYDDAHHSPLSEQEKLAAFADLKKAYGLAQGGNNERLAAR